MKRFLLDFVGYEMTNGGLKKIWTFFVMKRLKLDP